MFPDQHVFGKYPVPDRSLAAANGTSMRIYGTQKLSLVIGGRVHEHIFLVSDVDKPLLGWDFLTQHGANISTTQPEICFKCRCPGQNGVALPATRSMPVMKVPTPKSSQYNNNSINRVEARVTRILHEYRDIATEDVSHVLPRHGFEHVIRTTGQPARAKYRRLDPTRLASAKKYFEEMCDKGICRRSTSPWASPLHLVAKPDGTWRPCGDYRTLNARTVKDSYVLPNLHDFTASLAGKKFFSKIDLSKGYWQIPMHPDSIPLTSVITPFGCFEFLRMPFGICNAGCSFQRLMDQILSGLDYIFVYLDDILIFSVSEDEHEGHVRTVLQRLREAGLVFNPKKSEFFKNSIEYLGHKIADGGVLPLRKNVTKIQDFPVPSDRQSLLRFVGLCNFYRPFTKDLATILAPLTALASPKVKFSWSQECDQAFTKAKHGVAAALSLSFPVQNAPLRLSTDASDVGVGRVLEQCIEGKWQPVEFFSKKMSPPERKYSVFDRELLASYLSIRHFRHMLTAREFELRVDHKPLVAACFRQGEPWNARQARHLAYVVEFTNNITYIPGKENVVADYLSRSINTIAPALPDGSPPLQEFADKQKVCKEVQQLKLSSALEVEEHVLPSGDAVLVDVSAQHPRLLVPASLQQRVLAAVHGLSHPGVRATRRLLTSAFVWSRMNAAVKSFCDNCDACHRAKVDRHLRPPPARIPIPSRRFSVLHIDLIGPLPEVRGRRYILSTMDRHNRWFELTPLEKIDATTVAEAFITSWVQRYGVPASIVCDRGTQFTSALFTNLNQLLGTDLKFTTAYHPECNGLIERFHRALKSSLMARGGMWLEQLPWVALGLRAVPRQDDGISPAEHVFGVPLVLPGTLLDVPEVGAASLTSAFKQLRDGVPVRVLPEAVHQPVPPMLYAYVRVDATKPALFPKYTGPYRVLKQSRNTAVLQIGDREERLNLSRLKPFRGTEPACLPPPPRRGRPRRTPTGGGMSS